MYDDHELIVCWSRTPSFYTIWVIVYNRLLAERSYLLVLYVCHKKLFRSQFHCSDNVLCRYC